MFARDLISARLHLARKSGARWVTRGDDQNLADQVERLTQGCGLDAACLRSPRTMWLGRRSSADARSTGNGGDDGSSRSQGATNGGGAIASGGRDFLR